MNNFIEVETNPELLILTSQISQFLRGTQDDVLTVEAAERKEEKKDVETEEEGTGSRGMDPPASSENACEPAENACEPMEDASDSKEATGGNKETVIVRPTTLELECRSQPGPIIDVPKVIHHSLKNSIKILWDCQKSCIFFFFF